MVHMHPSLPISDNDQLCQLVRPYGSQALLSHVQARLNWQQMAGNPASLCGAVARAIYYLALSARQPYSHSHGMSTSTHLPALGVAKAFLLGWGGGGFLQAFASRPALLLSLPATTRQQKILHNAQYEFNPGENPVEQLLNGFTI